MISSEKQGFHFSVIIRIGTNDNDGDGPFSDEDCDDNDATVFPGASEICDGKDNDCNGMMDDGLDQFTQYVDADRDGFGLTSSEMISCEMLAGYVATPGDCDDNNVMGLSGCCRDLG